MLNDTLYQVLISVLSALICTTLISLVVVVSVVLNRQRILRFFGISERNPTIQIFVSRLEIKPGGTEAIEPIDKGYSGPAINQIEYMGALLVRDALRTRLLSVLPKRIQDWLSSTSVTLMALDPAVNVSPKTDADIPPDNMVIIGSSVYNALAKHYLDHPLSCFYFAKNDKGERVLRMHDGDEIPGRAINRELGIVQCFVNKATGAKVFVCAGLGTSATYGSVRHLVRNWHILQRKFKSGFAICLAFENQPRDSEAVVEPKVLRELYIDDRV